MKKEQLQNLIEQVLKEELDKELLKEGDDVIYSAFIRPFKDIADTAVHSIKSVTTKAGSDILKLAKMSIMSLFTWVGPEELKNIEKQADDRLQKYLQGLDEKYKDVLQRNFDALSSTDVRGFTFFLRPDLLFARKLITGTPALALEFLDTLTLGNPKVRQLKKKVQDFDQTKDFGVTAKSGGGGLGYVDYDIGDGGLEEAKNPKLQLKKEIEELLKDPDIIASMKKNPTIKAIAQTQLQTVIERAKELSKAKTFEDIKNFAGDDAAELEKKTWETIPEDAKKDITEDQKKEILDKLVPQFKDMYKKIYKSYITNLLKVDEFYPNDTKKVMEKINQL